VRSADEIANPVEAAAHSALIPSLAPRSHLKRQRATTISDDDLSGAEVLRVRSYYRVRCLKANVQDAIAVEAAARSQHHRHKRTCQKDATIRSYLSQPGTSRSVQYESDDGIEHKAGDGAQWPAALHSGFPPPPPQLKGLSQHYTPEGRRWVHMAEAYWNKHASPALLDDRGKWFSFAVRPRDLV